MSREELLEKFAENAAGVLSPSQRARLIEAVDSLDTADDASVLVQLSIPQ